jgi:hypothetical protein
MQHKVLTTALIIFILSAMKSLARLSIQRFSRQKARPDGDSNLLRPVASNCWPTRAGGSNRSDSPHIETRRDLNAEPLRAGGRRTILRQNLHQNVSRMSRAGELPFGKLQLV